MRVPQVPFGSMSSQMIGPADMLKKAYWVSVTNTGAVQVWVCDDQGLLDSGASANAGVPQAGHVIQPGINFSFGKVKGVNFFTRTTGAGGSLECTAYSDC